MTLMDESTLLAHALRDYMRKNVEESELSFIDSPLDAGEPYSAITSALSLAQHFSISMPPVFVHHINALSGWTSSEREHLELQLESLPVWWELAS
jgi:hypothetical protein